MTKDKFKVYEGVFDDYTLQTLEILRRKHYFTSIGSPIKTGKEADVYYGYKDDEIVAIKLYRITSANFKKISEYIARDYRFRSSKGNMRRTILQWVQKEYRNLLVAYEAGVRVPFPYAYKNNVIVMDYIDGVMLKDALLSNPQNFFEELLLQLHHLRHSAKLIHGDLSEYNILVEHDSPVIIDMGQAMSIKQEDDFENYYDLYERDVSQIITYFIKRYNLSLDEKEVFDYLSNESK